MWKSNKVSLFLGKEIVKGYIRDVWSSKIRLWIFENEKHQFTTYIPFDEILEIKEVNNEWIIAWIL